MAGERAGHSLQATVARQRGVSPAGRRERRRVARPGAFPRGRGSRHAPHPRGSRARASRPEARRPGATRVTFDEALVVTNEPREDFVALDDALEALAKFDERKSRVVELRFFGGLTVEETASVVEGVARNGDARLAAGEGVAAARDARRSLTRRLNARRRPGAVTPERRATGGSAAMVLAADPHTLRQHAVHATLGEILTSQFRSGLRDGHPQNRRSAADADTAVGPGVGVVVELRRRARRIGPDVHPGIPHPPNAIAARCR